MKASNSSKKRKPFNPNRKHCPLLIQRPILNQYEDEFKIPPKTQYFQLKTIEFPLIQESPPFKNYGLVTNQILKKIVFLMCYNNSLNYVRLKNYLNLKF
jgi:hypothetical protein